MKIRTSPCPDCGKKDECRRKGEYCDKICSWVVDGYWEDGILNRDEFIKKAVATTLYSMKDNDFLSRFLNLSSDEIADSSNSFLYERTADVYDQMLEHKLEQFKKELILIK